MSKSVKAVNKRVRALEKLVNKTMENKVLDLKSGTSFEDVPYTGYSASQFIRNLATGDSQGGRIGNDITLMSQTIRAQIRAPFGTGAEQLSRVRVLVVESLDYQGSGNDLTLNDVLEYGEWATSAFQIFISPYKSSANTNKRYKVHYDKVFDLNLTDKGYVNVKKRIAFGNKKNKGKVVSFASAIDTTPNNHRMFLFAVSDSGTTPHPQIVWNSRAIYKDA